MIDPDAIPRGIAPATRGQAERETVRRRRPLNGPMKPAATITPIPTSLIVRSRFSRVKDGGLPNIFRIGRLQQLRAKRQGTADSTFATFDGYGRSRRMAEIVQRKVDDDGLPQM